MFTKCDGVCRGVFGANVCSGAVLYIPRAADESTGVFDIGHFPVCCSDDR